MEGFGFPPPVDFFSHSIAPTIQNFQHRLHVDKENFDRAITPKLIAGTSLTSCGDRPRSSRFFIMPPGKAYKIASIPGDGIGSEVIRAGIEVLQRLVSSLKAFSIHFDHFDWSSESYKKHGRYVPEGGLEELKKYDAIFFGSVGAPDVPDHLSLWGLRLAIVQPLQLYANTRPTRVIRGTSSPLSSLSAPASDHKEQTLDILIIRENSEGEYAGQGGRTHADQPWETATEVAIFTRYGVERIMRFAFTEAQKRPRKLLTLVTKSNAQRYGLVLWDEVAISVSQEFPDVTMDRMLVDAMTTRMVLRPSTLDTIVATSLHADILSDLAASLAGSIGIAPTSNFDPTRQNPSMFEPIHGSAFDLVGKGTANPVGTFWTATEMLRWLGEEEAAELLMECIENVTENGVKTPDLGGMHGTVAVTEAVCREIDDENARRGRRAEFGEVLKELRK